MSRTWNMITKAVAKQTCIPLDKSAYFRDGDGIDSDPVAADVLVTKLYPDNEAA